MSRLHSNVVLTEVTRAAPLGAGGAENTRHLLGRRLAPRFLPRRSRTGADVASVTEHARRVCAASSDRRSARLTRARECRIFDARAGPVGEVRVGCAAAESRRARRARLRGVSTAGLSFGEWRRCRARARRAARCERNEDTQGNRHKKKRTARAECPRSLPFASSLTEAATHAQGRRRRGERPRARSRACDRSR